MFAAGPPVHAGLSLVAHPLADCVSVEIRPNTLSAGAR
jgi:hypothetical protein